MSRQIVRRKLLGDVSVHASNISGNISGVFPDGIVRDLPMSTSQGVENFN